MILSNFEKELYRQRRARERYFKANLIKMLCDNAKPIEKVSISVKAVLLKRKCVQHGQDEF